MRIMHRCFVSLLLVVLLAPAAVTAQSPATIASTGATIDAAVVAETAKAGHATVWVMLRPQASLNRASSILDWTERGQFVYDELTKTASTTQTGLRKRLERQGVAYESFWIVNALKMTASQAVIDDIAQQPEVERIIADQVYQLPDPKPGSEENTIQAIEWGIERINADDVWSTFSDRGEGIVVANIDSGVQFNHPALVSQYRGNLGGGAFNHNYNWFDPSLICGNPSPAPCDNNGHGTHTMGTMVGDDGAGNQIGVAPGATWIAAKGCETSSCSSTALLASGQWILAPTDLNGQNPRADLRPHIVNNSWGAAGGDSWYQATVDAWVAAGIFPMFANGNSGPGCGTAGSPGDYTNAYSSGAFDIGNAIASFSSRGAAAGSGAVKPDIAAPGANIRSAAVGSSYQSLSGTSMASPHVAGTIALMWSAAPSLIGDITTTRSLLDQTAIDTENLTCGGTAADNNVWGEGRLDALAAVTQSPRGPVGDLTGVVTDLATGDPIPDATVQVVGPASRSTRSGAGGSFSFRLPVGSYTLTISLFGYQTRTFNNVSVADGATTQRNASLTALPRHTVLGTARDSGGQVVVGASVRLEGTPIAPVSTDQFGAYRVDDVPAGSYSVAATTGGCTTNQTQPLVVNGAETLDFTLALRTDSVGYSCRIEPSTYIEANTILPLTGDEAAAAVTLPFAFPFYGQTYAQAFVSTNGFLNFLASETSYTNGTLPSSTTPNGAIYPFWDDLVIDGSASIRTELLGSAPDRQFVIEWRNAMIYNDTGRRMDFAVVLQENGHFLMHYRNIATDGREQGNSATLGIENQAGTVGLQYATNEVAVTDGLTVRYRINQGPPTVSAPVPVLLNEQRLSNPSAGVYHVAVQQRWTRSDADGIGSQRLQQSLNDAPYRTVVPEPSATAVSYRQALAIGSSHRYQVRAVDTLGAFSSYQRGSRFTVARMQETDSAVTYIGTWSSLSNASSYGGTLKTTTGGATTKARIRFTGRSIGVVATRRTDGGRADVYLNGVKRGTIDFYAATGQTRRIMFVLNGLQPTRADGTAHLLEIRWRADKNTASSGFRLFLDGLIVLR